MPGAHILKIIVSTQVPLALNSGESEWYGLVNAASIMIGMRNTAQDYGAELEVRLQGDATAAAGIAQRRGAGKIRHIETKTPWLQRHITNGHVTVLRKEGTELVADIGTKDLDAKAMANTLLRARLLREVGQERNGSARCS